jgi:hypothetical protein
VRSGAPFPTCGMRQSGRCPRWLAVREGQGYVACARCLSTRLPGYRPGYRMFPCCSVWHGAAVQSAMASTKASLRASCQTPQPASAPAAQRHSQLPVDCWQCIAAAPSFSNSSGTTTDVRGGTLGNDCVRNPANVMCCASVLQLCCSHEGSPSRRPHSTPVAQVFPSRHVAQERRSVLILLLLQL